MTAAVARTRRNRTQVPATSRSRAKMRSSSRRQSAGRPGLQVFDQVAIRNRARRRYVIIAGFVVLLAGLFAVALIQAQLVANQHRLDRLRSEIATSEVEYTRLERMVEEASAPSAIIDQAMAMGMVRAVDPVYLAPNGPVGAVPLPISLGSLDQPVIEGAAPVTVAASVGDVPADAAQRKVAGSVDPGQVDDQSGDRQQASSVATVAGTTAVSTGVSTRPSSASADESVATRTNQADVTVEQALADPTAGEREVNQGGSAPVWAGAVAGTGG